MHLVSYGLDNIHSIDSLLEGKRIGLLTTASAVNKDYVDSIEVINQSYNLTALFSPEHGARGEKQAGLSVETYVDERTGVTVYSLYSKDSHQMTAEQTEAFDILIYDVQDVGSRFYTYLANLRDCMKICAQMNKPVVVLDRPNVVGDKVEGNIANSKYSSIVCAHTMPQRYGLTAGEFAKMINEEQNIACDLHVVEMTGYKRAMKWEEIGMNFISPSPNLSTVDGCFLYNGTCYFEGTTLSEGRGTTRPFEYIGAPWIDPFKLSEAMNSHNLEGVKFQAVYFTPTFSKHQGEVCGGVRIHVTEPEKVLSVDIGIWLLYECKNLSTGKDFWIENKPGKYQFPIDVLSCCSKIRENFEPEKLLKAWKKESTDFASRIEKFRIYG